MATLTVGPGSGFEYNTLASAIAASQNGDVIEVQAGTYTNDFVTITTNITVEGVGGMVNLVATEPPPNEKGILTIGTASSSPDVTLSNMSFSGAEIPDGDGGNAAGIRYQAGNLTVNNCYFHDDQDGLLGTPEVDGTGAITINNTEFSNNGNASPPSSGPEHNIYVNDVEQLTIDNSYFTGPIVGNDIQSRAQNTTIENSRIDDPGGSGSYEINLPNGGNDLIENNVIEKGPGAQNPVFIGFGESGSNYANSSLTVTGNTVENDFGSGATFVWNDDPTFTASVTDNTTYGLTPDQLTSGPATTSGNTFAPQSDEPPLDTSPPFELCFLSTTQIRTPLGEVPVERLSVGDDVLTLRGPTRRIIWIGEGRVLATRGRRNAATPVIVRKGALADNVPHRNLRVTKGHSLYIDDVLIPVEFLVNHCSILWDDHAQEVKLYHIELDTHDVLLANGAAAESYRDDGNRWLFQNANLGWNLPRQEPCAPVLTGGPLVDAVWRRLLDRARPGRRLPLTEDADLHLLVDGRRVDATGCEGEAHVFHLSTLPSTLNPSALHIVSRAGAPAELGLARDPRILGVALRRLVIRNATKFRVTEAKDNRLATGFHAFEADNGFRWTDGDATIPAELYAGFTAPVELVLFIGATAHYPLDGCIQRVA